MQRGELILFDLDDTLVDTSDLYWRTRSKFVELIGPLVQSDPHQIIDTFEAIDSVHIKEDGFSPSRYLRTMLKTYENLRPRDSEGDQSILEAIEDCARQITTEFPKPIDGAKELLDWVFPRFNLALITRGEKPLQLKKLEYVGFKKYFGLIEIVERKTVDILKKAIVDAGANPSRTWLVGDSIQTDINPGIEAGVRCIWYAYHHKAYYWRQEHGHAPIGEFFKILDLRDAIGILEKSLQARRNFAPRDHF
ncbi:MAG TPA: HAD family hydrolase [Candidatus Udaeobacter sp.]|nr:HAD family hydrolase [Candidatus Udaeobacter sp.]